MDDAAAAAYLARIGAQRPAAPTLDSMDELTRRHLATVPFENLSLHLGEPVRLDEDALVDKLVRRRRGGFCYELNGGFALLLAHLGFDVTLLAARVATDDGWTAPFAHLTLRVDLGEPWIVDVGFGRFASAPLRLDVREPQSDPCGDLLLTDGPDGVVDVAQGGARQIRIESTPRTIADFRPTCWWTEHAPESHFTRSLTCSLPTVDGRVTLSDRLLITTTGGQRHERTLGDDAEVLAAYRDLFGIVLDRLPTPPS